MISFRARHRAVIRARRRAQIREEFRAALERMHAVAPLKLAEAQAHALMDAGPGHQVQDDELEPDYPLADPEPAHLHRWLVTQTRVHRRTLLLARGYWAAGYELPESLRRVLLGDAPAIRQELARLAPQHLHRWLVTQTRRMAGTARPVLRRWLGPAVPPAGPDRGVICALFAYRSETWAVAGMPP